MALIKKSFIDTITVRANGAIEIRYAESVVEMNAAGRIIGETTPTYTRKVLEQNAPLSMQDPKVAAIARAAWSV